MDICELLINFGLTRQEANIYIILSSEGELSGYEVSKKTGISRSNTYNSLANLVDKGAAYMIEGNVALYTPVKIEEFCNNKIRLMQDAKDKLILSMPEKKEKSSGYITIKGAKHILDKLINMLIEAKERVYLSLSIKRLELIHDELISLKERGIKLVIITNPGFTFEGAVVYHAEKRDDQVRLIVDSKDVLTGDIKDDYNATCLYSSNNNLVEVFKEALTNEIKLIELKKGRGENA